MVITWIIYGRAYTYIDSRILIGSVSRHTLKAMQDEHLKGLFEHAQQIRDQVIYHKSADGSNEDTLELV